MRWEKGGLIWGPEGDSAWGKTHAMVPTPVKVSPGEVRVYVGALDDSGVGRIGYIDLDEDDPRRVLRAAREPSLDIGEPGMFDDNGVLPSSVVKHDGKLF